VTGLSNSPKRFDPLALTPQLFCGKNPDGDY